MSVFSIGNHQFISLSQVPAQPNKQLMIEARAGVPGETVWNTGARGEPIQLLSVRDVPTVGDAIDLFAQYQELIGAGPQIVTWANVAFGQTQYLVLNVRAVDQGIYAIVGGVGGLSGQAGLSAGMIRAVWELLPINVAL